MAKAKAKPRLGKAERRSDTVDNDEIDDCAFPPRVASRARPMFEESAACMQMQRTCPRSRSIWMVTREATIQRWTRRCSRLKEPRVPAYRFDKKPSHARSAGRAAFGVQEALRWRYASIA
jgi:hypothetical protein